MTPEFCRRCGIVLDSPRWKSDDFDEHDRLSDEQNAFKEMLQELDTYDDLSDADKIIFDDAEAQALAAIKAFDDFAQNDGDGYGRFHEVWDNYRSVSPAAAPSVPPPPVAPPRP